MENTIIERVLKQLNYYKAIAERTMVQLNDDELLWQYSEDNNSIAIIVKHLWGNMLSRWTDFLHTDGEKEWRERDAEFEDDLTNRGDIMIKWEKGWQCVFSALEPLSDEQLMDKIYIRAEEHTVLDAIQRQLAHYAYHIGQIVMIGKMIKGSDWQSLSIPKGQSKAFNAEKMSKE